MSFKNSLLLIFVTLFGATGWSQTSATTNQTDYFSISKASVDPIKPQLNKICTLIDSVQQNAELSNVTITGSSSPDGPYKLNESLAKRRADVVTNYIKTNSSIPEELLTSSYEVCTWQDVCKLISASPYSCSPFRNEVCDAIDKGGSNVTIQRRLKTLDRGRPWRWLASEILPLQRNTNIEVSYTEKKTPLPGYDRFIGVQDVELVEDDNVEWVTTVPVVWNRYIYLKTNIPAWAMLWTNLALEVDVAPHWSFTVPVYYSGFNYFHSDTKFRTLALQPEVRYWVGCDNVGFFSGAHFGLGWYNVAFGGDKRYQDHFRHTPAIGGGIAIGYRFNFCHNAHWQMEATIGGGIYKLGYDVFQNLHNGLLIDRKKRTFYGIDQAAFTICYRFDIYTKKGGVK